jgi:pimeloyl-ACP methyl ester carboxylesterase
MVGVSGMAVETLGQGDDVVLVHGALSWGRDTFAAQLPLADQRRLHVVDRRGYAAAGPPVPGEVGWPVDVPDLLDLLERLGGAHVVGHSYGGVVALIAAGERPGLVRSLVVVEPPVYDLADDPEVAALAARIGEVFGRGPDLTPEEFYAQWASLVLGLHDRVIRYAEHHWTPEHRGAADATRLEALPTAQPIAWDGVRRIERRVVVSGGWPTEHRRASTRPEGALAARAFQLAAAGVAQRAGVGITAFDASSHTPQLTEPDAFNELLLRTWSPGASG